MPVSLAIIGPFHAARILVASLSALTFASTSTHSFVFIIVHVNNLNQRQFSYIIQLVLIDIV